MARRKLSKSRRSALHRVNLSSAPSRFLKWEFFGSSEKIHTPNYSLIFLWTKSEKTVCCINAFLFLPWFYVSGRFFSDKLRLKKYHKKPIQETQIHGKKIQKSNKNSGKKTHKSTFVKTQSCLDFWRCLWQCSLSPRAIWPSKKRWSHRRRWRRRFGRRLTACWIFPARVVVWWLRRESKETSLRV